jgi:NTP pyrophosphatase (non-canonical NTP hydrolase)
MTEVERWARDLVRNESEAFEKALKRTKEEKTMYIDGRWLTEPEIEAYIKRMRSEIAELRDKHENECRQISEYDIEVRTLREQQNVNDKLERITANYTFGQQRAIFVEECAEAIKAVCKVERAADSSAEVYAEKMSDLISEVADVLIMAQQMRLYLGKDKVDAEIQRKLDRQLQRIRAEVNTENE